MPQKSSAKLIILFLIILALVAGGYGLFIWFIVTIMKGGAAFGLLFVAVIAGIASFFNPCAFPILPAYLAQLYTDKDPDQKTPSKKSLLFYGVAMALGVTAFNIILGSVIGVLGAGFGKSLGLAGQEPSSFVRWLRGIIGGLLVLLGYSHITGRGINFGFLERYFPKLKSRKEQSPFAKMFSYGFIYPLVGIGCGGPILAGLSIYALSQGGFLQALLAFVVYSLVMAVLMILISILVALSKESLLKDFGNSVVKIKKASGFILLLVGLFLIISSIFVTTFTRILFP